MDRRINISQATGEARLQQAQAILKLGRQMDSAETMAKQSRRLGVGLYTIQCWQRAKGKVPSDKQWQKLLEYKQAALNGALPDLPGYLE